MSPIFTAGAITQEKDSQTYDILLSTPLTNGQIVLGSLLSRLFFVISLLLTLFATFLVARSGRSQTPETQAMPATANSRYRLSGPYTHKNLTIFLVHGKELMPGKNFLTLQEALKQKKVIVLNSR